MITSFRALAFCALLPLSWSGAACAKPAVPPAGRSAFYADAKHELATLEHSQDDSLAATREQISHGTDSLASEQNAVKEDGISLDPARLQAPLPPPDQNAAPLYAKLMQLLKDKPLNLPDYADGMSTRHAYTDAQIAAAQKIYDSRQDVWELVHQAADKPQCVFARNWALGPALTFPEFPTVREGARLLETEAYLLAHQGKYEAATQAGARGLRLAGHAGSDPSLISYLVGCACDAIALQSFSGILSQAGPNVSVDAEVTQAITVNRPSLSLRRGLIGDLVEFSGKLDEGRQILASDKMFPKLAKRYALLVVSDQDLPAFSPTDQRFLHHLWDAQEAEYLHNMRLLVDNADQPPAVRNGVFNQPQAAVADTVNDPVQFISNVLLPITAKVHTNGERVRTQEDVLISAAAALSARAGSGALPDSQPLTTLNAFSGKPLLYRREGDSGFVIYSLGPDGDFDGGQPGDKRQPTQAYFRYPAPAPDVLK